MAGTLHPGPRPDEMQAGPGASGTRLSHAALISAVALSAVFAAFALAAWLGPRIGAEFAHDADTVLTTTAAALLLPVAVFFLLRARHEGRQAGIAMAAGALMLALVTLGTAELAPLIASVEDRSVDALRQWSLLGALAAFALGLSDELGSRAGQRLMALPASVLLIALTGTLLPGQQFQPPELLLMAGWLAVVLAHGYAFIRNGQPHRWWIALGLLGLMLGDVARSAVADPELWGIAAGVVRVMGVLMMLAGLVGELEVRQWRQRQALDIGEAVMADLRAITDAVQRSLEERDHEARSALAAIEYTAHALRSRGAHVRQEDLEQLELAMVTEVELLRRLITMPGRVTQLDSFDVTRVVRGIVAAEAASGIDAELAAPERLMAFGSAAATAEVVQCLLENARRHAFGSRVWVEAAQRGPFVIVRVDDEGPGVPPERRTVIFKRGHDGGHPTSAGGRGLGLYIAARLAQEQRGHLWVQEADGGGASFRLALGAAGPEMHDAAEMAVGRGVGGMRGGEPFAQGG